MKNNNEDNPIRDEMLTFFKSKTKKAQITNLIIELLDDLKMKQTIKVLKKQRIEEEIPQQEDFQSKLDKLQKQKYKSENQKSKNIAKFLEEEYIKRIQKQQYQSALNLLSNNMQKYCKTNIELLSTYLLELPKKKPRLIKMIAPYFLKEKCPKLPHKKIMTAYFSNEVWFVKSNGVYTIAIDSNSNAKIFYENKIHCKKQAIHKKTIRCVNWKDQKTFGTCSEDKTAKLWSVQNFQLLKEFTDHVSRVSSIVFMNQYIITGGFDNKIFFYQKQYEKSMVASKKIYQIQPLKKKNCIITVTVNRKHINIIDIDSREEVSQIKQKNQIVSTAISKNQKYLFANISQKEPKIHVWNLQKTQLIQKWVGYEQTKFVLRMQHGGPNDQFLAIGSENGEILYFHISSTFPIFKFRATDKKTVNCVSWINSNILVECNDSKNVKFWGIDQSVSQIIHSVEQSQRQNSHEMNMLQMMKQRLVRMLFIDRNRGLDEDNDDDVVF